MAKKLRTLLKRRWLWLLPIGVCMVAAVLLMAYLTADLPKMESLADYNPPQVSKLYSIEGHVVGQFAHERRTVIPFSKIPNHVVRAFLAAEDAEFYQHKGLDYEGILRAFLKNLRPGAHLQGASTITQQTVKTLILGHERSLMRKVREVILARKLEHLLSKNDILHIYLNQIYLGSGAYGIEEAAQTYFNKHTHQLTLGEAAVLAGIPKHPTKYAPKPGSVASKQRQAYVLHLMQKHGWASQQEVDKALATPLADILKPQPYLGVGPHYVEHVRTLLVEKYGEEALYTQGLQIQLAMSAIQQKAAHQAIKQGVEDLAQREGYKGPAAKIPASNIQQALQTLHAAWTTKLSRFHKKNQGNTLWIWNLQNTTVSQALSEEDAVDALKMVALTKGTRVRALVSSTDTAKNIAHIDLGSMVAHIPLSSVAWARSFSPSKRTPPPKKISDVFMPGHLVDVQIKQIPQNPTEKSTPEVTLVANPSVQSALVAIDPHTRGVTALVGGYSEDPAQFNRAIQARRQPGSSFKPLLYAAGIERKTITPASMCADTPVEIGDKWEGDAWRPENFEDGRYDGNITYRKALMLSKNTCSAKLADKLGPDAILETARALGITSNIPHDLTIALGSGDVTPLELCNAYTTIAASGRNTQPVFIRSVKDAQGKLLESSSSKPTQGISPAAAYVVTSMMRSVITGGTGARALSLGRPLVGKTGTSNDSRNVWFSGFSPDLVATVWVGFDDNQSMGWETGSTGALPIWIQFMATALKQYPVRDFHAPEGVVFVNIDPSTGMPTGNDSGVNEVFVAGTEPSAQTQVLPSIYLEDEGSPVP